MNYKNSRDAAWQMLIKNKITALPVSVAKICKSEKIRLLTYEEGRELIKAFELEEHTAGNDAFCLGRTIFYDDTKPRTRQRFSVAHEIGHIILHSTVKATVFNREISPNDNPQEAEANVFASRLLAPLCILHYMNISSAEEVANLCDISMIAAEIRFKRLCEIRKRDREMSNAKGKGCFLLSPLERKVFWNFKKYIEKNGND